MFTWVSPDCKTYNTVDYILARKDFIKNVNDSHTVACIDVSDHRLVRCKIKLDIIRPQQPKSKPKYNVEALQDDNIMKTYQDGIKENLENNQWGNINRPLELNNLLTLSVKKAAEMLIKKKRETK